MSDRPGAGEAAARGSDVGRSARHRSGTIRTPRLELVPITESMLDALLEGDLRAMARETGSEVGGWLVRNPDHLLQVGRIARAAQALASGGADPGPGRVLVLAQDGDRRRAIGSIGFHRPADDQGRLVIGCSIAPAYRGRGLAAEALRAMIEWTARNRGIHRFLFHVSTSTEGWEEDAADLTVEAARGAGRTPLPGLLVLHDRAAPRRES